MTEILDVVNDRDEVIGQIARDAPDRAGKIFRMIFVGFYTPNKEIILQRRSLLKKSSPGLLTATVSGHVSAGQSYIEAAVRETYEESGLVLTAADLVDLGVYFGGDAMRAVYAYPFSGSPNDLQIEENEGDGFIIMPVAVLRKERAEHPERFAPFIAGSSANRLLDYIEQQA